MSKLLTNFLVKRPVQLGFFNYGLVVSNQTLDKVLPGYRQQLYKSSKSYVDGLIDLDEQFLKSTTSPFLFNKLKQEIDTIKSSNGTTSIDSKRLEDRNTQKLYTMSVKPYVIFGIQYQQHTKIHPFQQLLPLSRNRYIHLRYKNNWNEVVDKIINSHFSAKDEGKKFSITFESDLDTEEISVVDLNYQLQAGQGQSHLQEK